jgi:hypothetical protein
MAMPKKDRTLRWLWTMTLAGVVLFDGALWLTRVEVSRYETSWYRMGSVSVNLGFVPIDQWSFGRPEGKGYGEPPGMRTVFAGPLIVSVWRNAPWTSARSTARTRRPSAFDPAQDGAVSTE